MRPSSEFAKLYRKADSTFKLLRSVSPVDISYYAMEALYRLFLFVGEFDSSFKFPESSTSGKHVFVRSISKNELHDIGQTPIIQLNGLT